LLFLKALKNQVSWP